MNDSTPASLTITLVRVRMKMFCADMSPRPLLHPRVRLEKLGRLVLGEREGQTVPIDQDGHGVVRSIFVGTQVVRLWLADHRGKIFNHDPLDMTDGQKSGCRRREN